MTKMTKAIKNAEKEAQRMRADNLTLVEDIVLAVLRRLGPWWAYLPGPRLRGMDYVLGDFVNPQGVVLTFTARGTQIARGGLDQAREEVIRLLSPAMGEEARRVVYVATPAEVITILRALNLAESPLAEAGLEAILARIAGRVAYTGEVK